MAETAVLFYDIADDVIALMDHLGIEQFILAGMSMGGYIAQRLALKYPKRLKGLILIATYTDEDNPDTVAAYQQLRDNWHNPEARSAIIDSLLPVIIVTIRGNRILERGLDELRGRRYLPRHGTPC